MFILKVKYPTFTATNVKKQNLSTHCLPKVLNIYESTFCYCINLTILHLSLQIFLNQYFSV